MIYRELERKTVDTASVWETEEHAQADNETNDFDFGKLTGSEELEGLLPWLSDPIVSSVQVHDRISHSCFIVVGPS